MKKQSTESGTEPKPAWEGLEHFARQVAQELLQRVLADYLGSSTRQPLTDGGPS